MINPFLLFVGLFFLFSIGSFSISEQGIIFVLLVLVSIFLSISIFRFFNKIKFFLLAIVLIFSFTVPGEIMLFQGLLPITREGVELAFFNVLRLSNIFLIVFIMMKVLPQPYIVENVVRVILFLTFFGINKDRLISRVYLTFEYLKLYRNKKFKFKTLDHDIAEIIKNDSSKKVNPRIMQVNFCKLNFLWIIVFICLYSFIHFI